MQKLISFSSHKKTEKTPKRWLSLLLALLLLFSLASCGAENEPATDGEAAEQTDEAETKTDDLHEGRVRIEQEDGSILWAPVYENLARNPYHDAGSFVADGAFLSYTSPDYTAQRGVDVSEHQGEIDWAAVRAAGVEFAVIRAGYRGYSEGTLSEDAYFRANIEGALQNGLAVGVYFFSQALSAEEAIEEADFVLSLVEGYSLSLPIAFDWETVDKFSARSWDISGETLTQCAAAFVQRIREAGYEASIYLYSRLAYGSYDLGELAGIELWFAGYSSEPSFYYDFTMWQYSSTGQIDGISTAVDLDLRLIKNGG